jgi:hypothetical protein
MHALAVQMIDVGIDVVSTCLLKGHIEPQHILFDNVQIVFDRVRRVIAAL